MSRSQGEYLGADNRVKVCPVCHVGWEIAKVYIEGETIEEINYYGDWWNLRKGKELLKCPKCHYKTGVQISTRC